MESMLPLFGLFVFGTNTSVPLTSVLFDVNVNGFASQININQTYKNTENTDIECVYGFPINDYASITGFVVRIDGRIITSQFKKKDEAFKEYSDAIKRGDGAYLLDQSDRSDDTFVLSVGRLPPQKECTVSISYVAALEFPSEKKLRLVVPTALYPRYNPDKAKKSRVSKRETGTTVGTTTVPGLRPSIFPPSVAFDELGDIVRGNLNNASQIASGSQTRPQQKVNPPDVFRSEVPYKATLKANINMFSAIHNVSSPSHPISVSIQNSSNVIVSFGAAEQPLDRDLIIEVDVESVPQYDVQVEQTGPHEFAAMFSYVPKFDSGKDDIKAEIIFVLDCSGSMDDENKIGQARRALKIFLRSIPEGSYFNFYRFGSNFQSLFEQSTLYNADSFAQAEKYADGSNADLGGTEMLPPLQKVFESPPRPGFARQLFVLTDGEVTNTEEVIDLVKRNAYNTRVFGFGLGNSPSRSLVNGIALAGNGKSEFVKSGEVLEEKIGRQLNRALQPAVVDAAVSWEGLGKVTQVPTIMPPVYRGERQLAFAIFKQSSDSQRSGKKSVVLKIGGGKFETSFILPESKSTDYQQMILKLAARAMIKDLETRPTQKQMQGPTLTGSVQDRGQSLEDSTEKNTTAEKVTDISLSYGVLSKYVSLVAVEKRENATNSTAAPMELREIPVQKIGEVVTPHYQSMGSGASLFNMLSRPGPPSFGSVWGNSGVGGSGLAGAIGGAWGAVVPFNVNNQAISAGRGRPNSSGASFQSFTSTMNARPSWGTTVSMAQAGSGAGATTDRPMSMTTEESGSPLTTLLNKQEWNGSWKKDQQVENVTGVSLGQLQTGTNLTLSEDALTTLVVVEFIKEKYPDQKDVWQLLVDKALVFLRKIITKPNDLDAATLTIKNLIHGKH